MIISLSIIIMIKNNNNNNNSKNRQTTQILIDGSKQIACGINLLEVGLLGHTFNPSPVDSDSSPRWWCTDVGAVFGAADGLKSLTLLYDTREGSSQSLAVTKRWTVLSPAASFFLAKKGREDILLNYNWWSVEHG